MIFSISILFYFIIMTNGNRLIAPYNQPKLCQNATWNENAETVTSLSNSNIQGYDIFVTTNNTIYIPNKDKSTVMFSLDGNSSSATNLSAYWTELYHVVITPNNDLYVGAGQTNYQVYRWDYNTKNITTIMRTCEPCFDLFVTINNDLYCAIPDLHQVIRKSTDTELTTYTVVAGTGKQGNSSDTLNNPSGIFVDTNFDLYVADRSNNRIQLFKFGQTNGITIPANQTGASTTLRGPTGVVLDADKNIYVVDNGNDRIVRVRSNGFECVAGCSNGGSNAPSGLKNPWKMAFDSYGNIFVPDAGNRRIQKFRLSMNTCNYTETIETSTSTIQPTSFVLETSTSRTFLFDISYNQPRLSANAVWNQNATTFASQPTINVNPSDIFITRNNTVYVAPTNNDKVVVWYNKSNAAQHLKGKWDDPYSLFVTARNDLYVTTNKSSSIGVDRWIPNTTDSTPIFRGCQDCYDIFVDIKNNLYCSMKDAHQVIRKSLDSIIDAYTVVAGTENSGSASNELNQPMGIFVDTNLDLYVADCKNNRVQRFILGKSNATVTINDSNSAVGGFCCPSAVILDADQNLYIVDKEKNRIIRFASNVFTCIAGCVQRGASANELNVPQSIAFDSDGNIFVVDTDNKRIQIFYLLTNSLDQSTLPSTISKFVEQSTKSYSTDQRSSSIISSVTTAMTQSFNQTDRLMTTLASPFLLFSCSNQYRIGINCNISSDPCDMIKPCQNNGTCHLNTMNSYGYQCQCPAEINGTDCEQDHRLCRSDTCSMNGDCQVTSRRDSFQCFCYDGWTGIHCQSKINFCSNVTCYNNGICRPRFLDYSCECVSLSYSGRHCEITSETLVVRQMVCKSFGFVAIVCIVVVMLFVMIMDVLKYFFGMDPIKKDSRRFRRRKRPIKKHRNSPPPVVLRFVYVHHPIVG